MDSFTSIQVDDQGLGYRYSRAGKGASIIVAVGVEAEASRFHDLLAERFSVTLVSMGGTEPDAAAMGKIAAALDLTHFTLICGGKTAAAGLGYAMTSPEALSRLVLIAPDITHGERFAAVATPVLVLEGTVDRTPADDVGQRLAGSLPECYDILVYDATQALEVERPEAAASIVADFVDRGGGFTVTKPQGPIYP